MTVKCFQEGISKENFERFVFEGGKLDIIIDECDSIDAKIWIRERARQYGIPVLMDTSDRGLIDIERFDLEKNRPYFHGLLGELDTGALEGMSNEEKIPYVLKIIGEDTISKRMKASLMEVEQSIKTWPQLASSVLLGGAMATDVTRRVLLNQFTESGRFFVDIEELVSNQSSFNRCLVASPLHPALQAENPRHGGGEPEITHETFNTQLKGVSQCALNIIQAASLAPSGGNAQPWKWTFDGNKFELFLDAHRTLAMTDYEGLGALVGLGAAIENAILAAHKQEWHVKVKYFPAGEDSALAATLELTKEKSAETETHGYDILFSEMNNRHTNRKLSGRIPINPNDLDQIKAVVRSIIGAELQILTGDADLATIGELIGAADRIRMLDARLHAEMMSEVRWTPEEAFEKRDGLSVDSLELSASDLAGLRMCRDRTSLDFIRALKGGNGLKKMSMKSVASASAVGLITMPEVSRFNFLQGGRAFERAWLFASGIKISFHPMTALPYMFLRMNHGKGQGLAPEWQEELVLLRTKYEKLFSITGNEAEIMLFRISCAEPSETRSLRRNVHEILTINQN